MITKQDDGKYIISASEVGIYVVCPYSWKIKSIDQKENESAFSKSKKKGESEHKSWGEKNNQIHQILKSKTLLIYLVIFVILSCFLLFKDVFLKVVPPPLTLDEKIDKSTFLGNIKYNIVYAIFQLINTTPDIIVFIIILISAFTVINLVKGYLKAAFKETGIRENSKFFQIEGSSLIPAKDYISTIQGISGRPDAILRENNLHIPVEIKPLAKKLKDRYVFQLLVYIRLISEFYKKEIPYGYLILGEKKKRVKINNTEERQKILSKIITEMNDILEKKKEAIATPTPQKCQNCSVARYCKYGIF